MRQYRLSWTRVYQHKLGAVTAGGTKQMILERYYIAQVQRRKSSWTELNKLKWMNWTGALGPGAPNWTERTFQRKKNWCLGNWTVPTELMSNDFKLWTRRRFKFTNSFGPAQVIYMPQKLPIHEQSSPSWCQSALATLTPWLSGAVSHDRVTSVDLSYRSSMTRRPIPRPFTIWVIRPGSHATRLSDIEPNHERANVD